MSDTSNLPIERRESEAAPTASKPHTTEGMLLPKASIDASLDDLRLSLTKGVDINLSRRLNLTLKRAIDIVVSAAALIPLSLLFIVIAIVIRTDSSGPAIFRQVRWGKNNTKIKIFKFRSMHEHLGDSSGKEQTTDNDPRTTRIGGFLRRHNIDELPQLLNVLLGDMSLVGPRCHVPDMLANGELYEDAVPGYMLRHAMRPGITGLAQCNGFRGPTTDIDLSKERVRYDLAYVRDFSVWLDFKIAWKTMVSEFKGGTGS